MDFYITDLLVYKVGNSLWKLVVITKTIKPGEAEDLINVFRWPMKKGGLRVVRFEDMDLQKLLWLAMSEKLMFYDASYIVASEAAKATLATEDAELREKARKYVDVVDYKRLVEKLLRIL